MSSSLTSKLSDLTVAAHGVGPKAEILNGNFDIRDSHIDADKANPWKARQTAQATDNKLLEADAWPEPSAPTERRAYNQKVDEKPKNKKPARKWQNIEIEPPAFTPRGRGGGGGNRFPGANGPNSSAFQSQPHGMPPVRGRRGPMYSRGRVSEAPRGNGGSNLRPTNGFYHRPPERMPYSGRSGNDERISRSFNNEASVSQSVESSNSLDFKETLSKDNHISEDEVSNQNSLATNEAASQACTSNMSTNHFLDQSEVASVDTRSAATTTNRRFTGTVVPDASVSGRPGRYLDSTYPRSRRPLTRNHPFPYAGPQKGPPIVSQTLAIPPVTPVYLLPSVLPDCIGSTLINTTVPLNTTAIPEGGTTLLDNNSLQTVIVPTNAVSMVAAAGVPATAQFAHPSMQSSSTSDIQIGGNLTIAPTLFSTEVVSLEQMLEVITKFGWENTKIPDCLKDNPAVLASRPATMGKNAKEEEHIESEEGNMDKQPSESGSTGGDRQTKHSDVVIVGDNFFFVPRNVHHTKFLKIRSKHDYIRHHVEYYFSDANLHRDTHLQSILSNNLQTCPLPSLLEFNRLRWVNATESELLEVVLSSPAVNVIYANNKPVGVAPSTAVSVLHHSTQFSPKTTVLEVGDQQITGAVVETSQIGVGTDESGKNAKTDDNSNMITAVSESSVSVAEVNDCLFEPMLFPVYAGNQVASSPVLNMPFLMSHQRLTLPVMSQNQLTPGHQFIPLTPNQGYIFPPYTPYPLNPSHAQGIPSLQFSPQAPFCVGVGNTVTSGEVTGIAAAVAAQQQQTTPFSNAQTVYVAPQTPTMSSRNGHSESAASPPLVPTFYRFATPQPSAIQSSSFGHYVTTNQQPVANPTNQYYFQLLPTIQSNIQGGVASPYLPVTTPNTTLAAAVVGRNLTPVNQAGGGTTNGSGYVLPMFNFPQPQQMPYITNVSTAMMANPFIPKFSAVSAKPHQVSGGGNGSQRLVNSQHNQVTTQNSVRSTNSVSVDTNVSDRKSTPAVDVEVLETSPT